ncbi:alpha/beta-type small acid-soluble spore protein [Clostridioides mangenotii]|uniref:small, acid-soluble spore protein, alpha/beta type n=1 Tax=Metaclostridioides mangenotii TaxID=1540 RepID=UPI001C124F6E|nr:small, acid-soluble spore protein, alpha/beta type [Clostridioides mangenotii]MBU5307069.1 alpha/beta-type small acid-soluble spore protein [Clostridioides mangenotii]MCR1955157.1 alpha/beta-type small acid-soluble spore protein [Clostridioides mangenotii]
MNAKNDKDVNYRGFDNKKLEVNKITKVVNGKNTKIITNNDYMKYEIASELGLLDKVKEFGWAELTAKEAGQIGGILTSRNRKRKKEEYR